MGRKKVLLVDDSETALVLERMLLKSQPYDLITARSGLEALTKADTEKPDLILMDVMMPQMGGFDTCLKLRSKDSTKHIPVIFVTTHGEKEFRDKGQQMGCSDYVTKPINGPELVAKINRLLGSRPS